MTTRHVGEFGTREVGRFDGRFRRDVFVCKKSGEREGDPLFAVDSKDDSDRHDGTIGNGYDRRCGTCWLGYGHTKLYHNANITNAK